MAGFSGPRPPRPRGQLPREKGGQGPSCAEPGEAAGGAQPEEGLCRLPGGEEGAGQRGAGAGGTGGRGCSPGRQAEISRCSLLSASPHSVSRSLPSGDFCSRRKLRRRPARGGTGQARAETEGNIASGRSRRPCGLPAMSLASDPSCPLWTEARLRAALCLGRAGRSGPGLVGARRPRSSPASHQGGTGRSRWPWGRGGAEPDSRLSRTHKVPSGVTSSDPGTWGGRRSPPGTDKSHREALGAHEKQSCLPLEPRDSSQRWPGGREKGCGMCQAESQNPPQPNPPVRSSVPQTPRHGDGIPAAAGERSRLCAQSMGRREGTVHAARHGPGPWCSGAELLGGTRGDSQAACHTLDVCTPRNSCVGTLAHNVVVPGGR